VRSLYINTIEKVGNIYVPSRYKRAVNIGVEEDLVT
jgi:hypothetical protein